MKRIMVEISSGTPHELTERIHILEHCGFISRSDIEPIPMGETSIVFGEISMEREADIMKQDFVKGVFDDPKIAPFS